MSGSNDPVERAVEALLKDGGVKYERHNSARLDFYLPDFDIYIECKQFPTERIVEQLGRAECVVVIKGRRTVAALRDLIKAFR